MTVLDYERRRAELLGQSELLRSSAHGADMTAPVPGCPGWQLGELLRHVGGTHRWAETVVRTRAAGPVPEDLVDDVAGYGAEKPEVLDAWVAEGAARLAATLGDAAPGTPVWTPGPGGTAAFWARRMLHETVVHRADACRAVGAEFTVEAEVALDAVEEWMGFCSVPEAVEPRPGQPALLGPGRTLCFRATDAPPGAPAEWLVDLTGDTAVVRRTAEPAAVTVRAPSAELVLLLYGRRAAASEHIAASEHSAASEHIGAEGDLALLALWLERSGFWLRE